MSTRIRNRRGLVALLVGAFIGGSVLAAPAAAADPVDPAGLVATPLTPIDSSTETKSATSRMAQSDPAVLAATGPERVPLLVKLDYDSVATYSGGQQGLQPTSPAVTDKKIDENPDAVAQYETYVSSVEDAFTAELSAAIPTATVGTRLRTVYGGIAVSLPADQAKLLLKLPGVVAVQADTLNQPLTDSSPQFIGAPTLYKALGSNTLAGQGAIVGVLDSGAWPEHPSLGIIPGLQPAPAKANGEPRTCDFGDNPLTPATDVFVCNDKLISGQPFIDTYNANTGGEMYPDSARDSDGHGTHTATTSAGSPVANATVLGVDRGAVHGIAPGAHVAVYKVCGASGCFSSDSAAAVAQAIADGVDVINFSISGGTSPYTDPVELAFLDAYEAGVFVAASAGNDGPGPGTVNHFGPWLTTVAASTQQRAFESTLTVASSTGTTFTATGASITAGVTTSTPVVLASAPPYSNQLCNAPAPPGLFAGKIVVCERGGNGRVNKGYNVNLGGAAGMILYNPTLADVETDNHWLPTVHLADGTELLAFLASNPSTTATFTAGQKASGKGDVMAAFSSRGAAGPWLKPDVTAPGVEILAGATPTPDSTDAGPPGQYYQAIAGTSMSSPHVAGSAALLASLHPTWSPGQIKSALMTTAKTSVVKEDLVTPAGPFDMGAGRIDLTKAGDPGLTLDVSAAEFRGAKDNERATIDLNLPSINVQNLPGTISTKRLVTNVTGKRMTYVARATAPAKSSITISPSRFSIRPGESVELKISIDASKSTSDLTQFGAVVLDEVAGKHDLHLPVAFTPGQGSVALDTACAPETITLLPRTDSTCTVTATNNSPGAATVDLKSVVSSKLRVTSVSGAANDGRGGVVKSNVSLAGTKPAIPAIGPGATVAGYLPLDTFGLPARAIGDEQILNYNVPAFVYAGATYTQLGVDSNGYLVVGGGSSADNNCCDILPFPNSARPNNVLAPFWTDLDGTGAPGYYIGTLTDGVSTWLVVEWRVYAWGTTDLKVFQTWIGLNGVEDVAFTYPSDNRPTAPGGQELVVGAENADGSEGARIPGAPTEDLVVTNTPPAPGGSVSYTFTVQGRLIGSASQTTTMTTPAVPGTTIESDAIRIKLR